jgi:hypothetical protein
LRVVINAGDSSPYYARNFHNVYNANCLPAAWREGRRSKEEGGRKKEEGRRRKEEGGRKKEEGRVLPFLAEARLD